MKKLMTFFGAMIFASAILTSCGGGEKKEGNEATKENPTTTTVDPSSSSSAPSTSNQEDKSSTEASNASETPEASKGSGDCDKFCSDYEAFANEYIAFMKKYKANPNDPSMLAEYSSMVSKAADMEKSSKDCASDVKVAERISKIPAKIELDNEPQIRLYCDYVYLDTDERRSVAQMSHEYLVPLLQHQEFIIDPNDPFQAELLINFNHPTKEIIFTVQRDEQAENRCCDFGNSNDELFSGVKLLFNGQCILGVNDTKYLRLLQNYEHHTNIPRENIYTYSFALNPEELQPSGTINFTRLDNNKLKFEFSEQQMKNRKLKIKVFAPYYNVLRITDGMSSLVYYC